MERWLTNCLEGGTLNLGSQTKGPSESTLNACLPGWQEKICGSSYTLSELTWRYFTEIEAYSVQRENSIPLGVFGYLDIFIKCNNFTHFRSSYVQNRKLIVEHTNIIMIMEFHTSNISLYHSPIGKIIMHQPLQQQSTYFRSYICLQLWKTGSIKSMQRALGGQVVRENISWWHIMPECQCKTILIPQLHTVNSNNLIPPKNI